MRVKVNADNRGFMADNRGFMYHINSLDDDAGI